jgi:hypothetical protein
MPALLPMTETDARKWNACPALLYSRRERQHPSKYALYTPGCA